MPRLGEGGFRLGEPEGSPVGEVLPCLGEEKLRLGEPGTATKCCFSYCIVICARWLFGKAPNTKGALSGYVNRWVPVNGTYDIHKSSIG